MRKPYTESDFSNLLDSDLIWRRKDLSDLKLAIKTARTDARPVLLRSLITMIYAHWEGYIKTCTTRYFQHITLRKIKFKDLERQMYTNSFLAKLDSFFQTKTNIQNRCGFINEILDSSENHFSHINPSLIETKSNLNSDVLKELCVICGIDYSYFDQKKTLSM